MKIVRDLLVLGSGILSVLYLLNLGFGFVEFIPDNVPIFGNLDRPPHSPAPIPIPTVHGAAGAKANS